MESPFKIINQTDPNRIQISYKSKGTIYLINTPEGFIIDIYDDIHDELLDTMTVWDDDLK